MRGFSLIAYCSSVQKSESSFGQQQVVSTETMLGGAEIDGEEDENEKRLCLFGNNPFVYIFHAFLYY